MASRRDFQIRQPEDVTLQPNTVVQFIDGGALANYDVSHFPATDLHG
jgi:hypothetical protein